MAKDVIITPLSGLVDFQSSSTSQATIELDDNNNLKISGSGGTVQIGNASSDVYIGTGAATVDIIFQQDGSVRGTGTETICLGMSGDNIVLPSGVDLSIGTTSTAQNATTTHMGNMSFGLPGNGANTCARFLSIEGNTDASGEGSSRIFFTEHNSTTASMSNYGMSIGYRGGGTSVTGADGNVWGGLGQIGNGCWGMWGHDNSVDGSLIMYGDRQATFVCFNNNHVRTSGAVYAGQFIDNDNNSCLVNPSATSYLSSLYIGGNTNANGTYSLWNNGSCSYLGTHADISTCNGAFRFFDGSNFRGGLGLDTWAHAGLSSDITMYIQGDNDFFISTNGTKRFCLHSSGACFYNMSSVNVAGCYIFDGSIIKTGSGFSGRQVSLLSCSTGSTGLEMFDSSGSWKWTMYGTGGDVGFLQSSWGSWGLRYSIGSQVLYLNNNTTYYLAPNSTSNMNYLLLAGNCHRFQVGHTCNTSTADTIGLHLYGNYTTGQYAHRLRKYDHGGGVPLYIDSSGGTANVFSACARFGTYTGNSNAFEVFGNSGVTGQLCISSAATGGGNLKFTGAANPYICASSYIIMPGGLYVSGGTAYFSNGTKHRGGVGNDSQAWLCITGGTAGDTSFGGNVGIGTTDPTVALDITCTGVANSPTLRLNNTSSSAFIHSLEACAPNLASGQTNILVVGKAACTKNSGYIGYYWTSDASNSNFVSIGHWGSDHRLRVYGDGTTCATGQLCTGGNIVAGVCLAVAGGNSGYLRDVTGNYGSIEISGGATGGWNGYSIGGRAVFMHDDSTATGIYDDVNNKWLYLAYHCGESRMFHNGTVRIRATGNGAFIEQGGTYGLEVNGSVNGKIVLSGATSPFIRFQESAADKAYIQWNCAGFLHIANQEDNTHLFINDDLRFCCAASCNTVWHSGNDGSGSGLDADLLDGLHLYQIKRCHSGSDFPDGTKVLTSINANVTSGASFVIEVTGKSYSGSPPFSWIGQGYLYNNTIINCSAGDMVGYAPAYMCMFQDSTNCLAFWWPRVGYWHSFDVHVRDAGGSSYNTVTSITNAANPSGCSKQVCVPIRKSWTDLNDGSGSGLDADTVDGIQGASFLRSDADDTTTGKLTFAKGASGDLAGRTGFSDFLGYNASYGSYIGGGVANASRYIYAGGYFYDGSGVHTLWHAGNDGSGSGLDADTVDGLHGSCFIRCSGVADQTISNSSTILRLRSTNAGCSMLILGQSTDGSQGTGVLELTQDGSHGGGISYNGDGSPAFVSGETADHVTFYNLNAGTRTEVFHYPYNSTTVNFNSNPTVAGNGVWHSGNDGSGSGLDADLLDGVQGSSFLRSDTADTFTGTLTMGTQQALVANNYGTGVYGLYSSYRYQHVWSMGTSYNLAGDGTTPSNLYGLAWTHTNVGGQSKAGLGHQLLLMMNGSTYTALGDGIWTAGRFTSNDDGADQDFRVEAQSTSTGPLGNKEYAIFVDASAGAVGIGTSQPSYALEVNGTAFVTGTFSAGTKNFLIDHPTKENYMLRHGSLEGPENAVYVRGTTTSSSIELPEYWTGLVDEDTITATLTPRGKYLQLFLDRVEDNEIHVGGTEIGELYDYVIYGTRKDVEDLIVEFERPVGS